MAIADQLSRLNELRQNLAAALAAKNVEAAETEGLETLVPKVGTIETGVQLPELTNPASAADIASGKQAINASGEVLTGTGSSGYQLETISLSTSSNYTYNAPTGKTIRAAVISNNDDRQGMSGGTADAGKTTLIMDDGAMIYGSILLSSDRTSVSIESAGDTLYVSLYIFLN